jgi:hypothetical protein
MRRLIASAAVALLTACGGGGGGGGSGQVSTDFEIVTQAVAPGNVGRPFFQRLQARGGTPPYAWWVSSSGAPLPDGVGLTTDGVLAGTPETTASGTVVIVAQDARGAFDLMSAPFEVRDIVIAPSAPAAVPPGTTLAFSASGGAASYSFTFSANSTGATLSPDGAYTAGGNAGVDVLRATDSDGFFDEVAVTVGDDPFIGFRPNWGATDVWWIDWDVVYDPDPTYASDFDQALVSLGLRHASSTDAVGTEEDRLARMLVIRRALGHLSTFYGNGFDGSPRPGGLSISFVGPAGTATGTSPAPGGVFAPGGTRYNTICTRYGDTGSVVGTAWYDAGNADIEHDCGNPGGIALGVFVNRILGPYLLNYGNPLAGSPIRPDDVSRLGPLLLGEPPADARAQTLASVADSFGRVVAAVLAHEIGHSLGLAHSSPSQGPGDLMNASLSVSPGVVYAFNPGHWATLLSNLPGPNR